MSKKSVFCIVEMQAQVEGVVASLQSSGFSANDISVLFPDKSSTREFAHEKHTKAPEGAVTGAGTGAAVGATFGLLLGIGALAIPGLGPFIAAGPLMSALGGAAVGGVTGGIAGTLIGLGIPELEAKRYEGRIQGGNALIAVHAEDSDQVKLAKEVFENAGGEDICTSSESSVPRERRSDHAA